MPIKNIGLSFWNATTSRPSSISTKRGSQSSTPTPVAFGLPSPEDPDPFGVKALEAAGLEIKEAGSSIRPNTDAFDYKPSPTSPVFRLSAHSLDGVKLGDTSPNSRRNSKRSSKRSLLSIVTDHGGLSETRDIPTTPPALPPRGVSPTHSLPSQLSLSPVAATLVTDVGIMQTPDSVVTPPRILSIQRQLPETIDEDEDEEEGSDYENEFSDDEDIIIEEISISAVPAIPKVLATPISMRAKVVSIRRRVTPILPLRSPLRPRFSGSIENDLADDQDEVSTTYSLSPDKSAFDNSEHSPNPWSEQTSMQDNESIRHKGSISISLADDGEDSGREFSDEKEDYFKDAKETTPVAPFSDFVLSSPVDTTKVERSSMKVVSVSESLKSVKEAGSTPRRFHLPDHKSSISGSTLASKSSISSVDTAVEPNSEPSLADLIKQGLSADLVDADLYTDRRTLQQYEENDESDYADHPSPESFQVHHPTSGTSISTKTN